MIQNPFEPMHHPLCQPGGLMGCVCGLDGLRNALRATTARCNLAHDALEKIMALDPGVDSKEGDNEWGEADCFRQAQAITNQVLTLG